MRFLCNTPIVLPNPPTRWLNTVKEDLEGAGHFLYESETASLYYAHIVLSEDLFILSCFI